MYYCVKIDYEGPIYYPIEANNEKEAEDKAYEMVLNYIPKFKTTQIEAKDNNEFVNKFNEMVDKED